jgi:hypothetical protein
MGKVATKPAKKKAPAREKKPVATRKTATSGVTDELSSLALANKELEDVERAKSGSQLSFITLVKANSKAVDKNHADYIPGLKPLEYAIVSKKLRLGAKLDATVIGMFKLYGQVARKEKEKDLPKTIGFWMPEDAAQFPMVPNDPFRRQLPDGSTLEPVHWVFAYLHKFPEVEDGLIAFRSIGNSVYSDLQKLVKAESSVVTELRFTISHQDKFNKAYDKTDYYPKFEISGRNYKLWDGKVVKTKDSDLDAETLKDILTRSKTIHENYAQMRLVAKRNVAALIGPAPRAALSDGKDSYEDDDEGDEAVSF